VTSLNSTTGAAGFGAWRRRGATSLGLVAMGLDG
jgi:hypothetical protein